MKVEVAIVLFVLMAVATFFVFAWLVRRIIESAPKRWEVVERTNPGSGTLHIGVARGTEFREVKELPPGDPYETLSEITLAKRTARDLADALNKR